MGGDSPKEYRSPLKGHGKRRGSKVESRLFQRMPQRTRQKHQRRLLRAVRAVPRTLALLVMCYALGLVIYFGKYRVRPRHHHAPELPAVLREGEVETSSARRLLCSAAPLRDRSSLVGDDGFRADGDRGGARGVNAGGGRGGDGTAGGVPSRVGGVSSFDASGGADALVAGAAGSSSARGDGSSHSSHSSSSSKTSLGAPLSIKRGRFRGHPKTFQPPEHDIVLNPTDARVFVLTGASADDPASLPLLHHFISHYVEAMKVPASHVMVIVHTKGAGVDDDAVRAMTDLLRQRHVFHEVWEGEALLFSAVAHHWENHLANAVDEEDWVVVADLDEHVQPPGGQTVPGFLGSVDEMGYSLVHGAWVDRLAETGELVPVSTSENIGATFPLRCSVGACGGGPGVGGHRPGKSTHSGPGHTANHGVNTYALHGLRHHSTLVGVVGGGQRVWAHRAQYPILDVRTLQDFGLDDVVTASRLAEDFNAAYPIPLKVQHYQWRKGADAGFERRGREYEACNLNEQKDAVAGLLRSLAKTGGVVSQSVCPDIVCHREDDGGRWIGAGGGGAGGGGSRERNGKDSSGNGDSFSGKDGVPAPVPIVHDKPVGNGGAPGGYPGERRVVIFASVWTHVDGVSRTMKRLAHHLGARSDSSVFVMSPDLAEHDFTEAANNDRYHVADVPHVPMPGRGEYKMAAPLQARQRHQMETFAPHVVHVAAPDMLGHSALRWAAENGVCSVCSYHTAYDTYLQYYRVGVLATPLRQMLGGFYSSCDVVATPSYAAAEHLSDMGVPRERMGFFPRGINLTMYSPAQRSLEFRRDVMGVGSKSTGARPRRAGKERGGGTGKQSLADAGTEDGEVVILWVARIVREKGLGSFAKTVTELLTAKREGSIEGLPPFRVVVAGDGPDLPWLRRQIEHFPEVKILGHTGGDRLSRTYAAGDVFFFPSRTEVIPNNLIESMASGLAVVTDDVGVNRAIVKDGVTGVLVGGTEALPGDVTAYVDALVTLLRDPERRRRMGKAARKSTHGLTWERTFGSLRRSYDRCRPGRPYARHLDPNVPGSKAATDLAARDVAYGDATDGGGGVTVRSGAGAVHAHGGGANSHEEHGVSVSGALLGISAAAAGGGGGGVASALAAASSALWHPTHHEHAAGHATATLHAVHEQRIDSHLEDSSSSSSSSGGGGSSSSSTSKLRADSGDPRYVPGSGPGDVNVGGVRERDVIVDPGAPPGSLLYRLSYGMTGGYVRSIEDARGDDEAIAAAEAAAAEAAARALSIGTWGGGGLMGAGGGFFANSRVAKTTKA